MVSPGAAVVTDAVFETSSSAGAGHCTTTSAELVTSSLFAALRATSFVSVVGHSASAVVRSTLKVAGESPVGARAAIVQVNDPVATNVPVLPSSHDHPAGGVTVQSPSGRVSVRSTPRAMPGPR